MIVIKRKLCIVSFVSFQQSPHWQWQQQVTLVEAMGQHGVCMEALFIENPPLLLVGGTGKLQIKQLFLQTANKTVIFANETAAEILLVQCAYMTIHHQSHENKLSVP